MYIHSVHIRLNYIRLPELCAVFSSLGFKASGTRNLGTIHTVEYPVLQRSYSFENIIRYRVHTQFNLYNSKTSKIKKQEHTIIRTINLCLLYLNFIHCTHV